MSLAAETRERVREHPFLLEALRAGVVNHRAAAAFLDVGETDAVAAALRRYRDDLADRETTAREVRVTVQRGVGVEGIEGDDALLSLSGARLVPEAGTHAALLATGDVDVTALAAVLDRLGAAGVTVAAAGVLDGALLVAVDGRETATALRLVERTLEAVPEFP